MKKLLNLFIVITLLISVSSCKKSYLDINNNPNAATTSTPELTLPAAMVTTASLMVTYHDYGSYLNGYHSNAGGYSYTGSVIFTYNFTNASNTGLFTSAFANLRDYQYIIDQTADNADYANFNAVARIMKSYTYQKLVDEYGNVPYSEALKGQDLVNPKYDDAATVYKALVTDLDVCIAQLQTAKSNTTATELGTADVMFDGNTTKWIQFANNIKLRLLTRARSSSISDFVNTAFNTFSSEGFLTDDAIIDPGYSTAGSYQNPMWNAYHSSYTGTATGTGQSRIPSTFVMAFYNGIKLTDTKRGELTYKNFGTTPTNQLGNEDAPSAISGFPAWYIGSKKGSAAADTVGILKSRVMGQVIFPASETYFLLAEAALNGHLLTGLDAAENFDKGIEASFNYLEKTGSTNVLAAGEAPAIDTANYKAANTGNYLANYTSADTYAKRLEAIITQKYIALNYIDGYEAWTEFRRTTYPKIVNGSTEDTETFASLQSASTRIDKLPLRGLYPQDEVNINPNVPTGLNVFTTKIFWDPTSDEPATN